jgi:hypothetical protein
VNNNIEFLTKASDIEEERRGLPVRKFTGKLSEIEPVSSEGRGGSEPRWRVRLNFSDVDLASIESVVPWQYPTVSIEMNYPNIRNGKMNGNSTYARFLKSAETLGYDDLKNAIGLSMTIKATEREFTPEGESEETPSKIQYLTWEVLEIKGGAPKSKEDEEVIILDLMHGSLDTDFAQAALENPVTRQYQAKILDNTFISEYIEAGKIERDEQGRIWVKGRARTS